MSDDLDANMLMSADNIQRTPLELLVEKIKMSSYGLKRTYSTIDISADKWLMVNDPNSLEKLENPPSLTHGLSRDIEKDIRYLCCELIQSGAILLNLPQTAAATGQILFHRFHYQKSFVRYNFEHTVMACLLLASKIEEEPRRPRDVFHVYNRLKEINTGERISPTSADANYKQVKQLMIRTERRILNTLGFVVHVHHPHKLIYVYLHTLDLLKSDNRLLQKAWSYMNDGLRTDIFLRYRPETIACACIHLAAKTIETPIVLPKSPFPWYELFDVSDRDVRTISIILMELYAKVEIPKLNRLTLHIKKLYGKLMSTAVNGSGVTVEDVNSSNTPPTVAPTKRTPTPVSTDVSLHSQKVVRTVKKKFDFMKEKIQEKRVSEKRKSDDRYYINNSGRERRRSDREHERDRDLSRKRERSASKSPKKSARFSRSRSPSYKRHKHEKHSRKHKAY